MTAGRYPAVRNRHAVTRPPLPAAQRVAVGLLVFLAVTGYGGGVWMITHPSSWIPVRYLDGTPFTDWLLPGVALFLVNGVLPTIALLATASRRWWAWLAQIVVGVSLLGWLAVQIPVIGFATQFQVTYGTLAVALIALGLRARDSRRGSP